MDNYARIRWVLLYTLGLNLLVTAVKLAIGFLSGSLSVVADGFDSLLNSAANIVGLAGVAVAARPPDPGHPYGHRRFETLATVAIGILIFITTAQLLQSAIQRLLTGGMPAVTALTFVAPLFSIAVQGYVAIYEYRQGRRLKSQILIADALHTRADVLVSVSVVVGLALVRLGFPQADPVLAILIAGFIAYIGLEIVRDSARVLADAAALDPQQVERIARAVPGVETAHRVRSRGQEDEIYLDLHVHVAPDMPVQEAHEIAHDVERRLYEQIEGLRDAIVHVEPAHGPEHRERDLNDRIREVAARLPGTEVYGVEAHDVRGRLFVVVYLRAARPLPPAEVHALADRLEGMLREGLPEVADVDVHLGPAEPGVVDAEKYQEMRAALDVAAAESGVLGDCYDLAVSPLDEGIAVDAHWECTEALTAEQADALRGQMERRVRERLPHAARVRVHVK